MWICEQTVEMLEKRMHFLNYILLLLLLLFRPKIDMIFLFREAEGSISILS